MKNTQTTLYLAAVALICATSCKNDDNPTPANKLPGAVEVATAVDGNSVALSWTPAVDPEGDAVTYAVIIDGDTLAKNLTATNYLAADLRYEKAYSGKVVAKDDKGAITSTDFSFTTGFMFLKSYEENGIEYFLGYNDEKELINIETEHTDHNPLMRNEQGRIINMGGVSYGYNSGGYVNVINDGSGEGTVFYDSKNRIVRMSCDYNFSPTNKDRVIRDHVYNDQDQLVQLDESLYNFSYAYYLYSRFKIQYDSKGNIVQVTWEVSYDNVTFNFVETRTFEYDDKKNPWYTILTEQTNFATLNISAFKNTMLLYNSAIYATGWMSKNNLKSVNINYEGGFTRREYTYTYNDSNYPITAEIDFTSSTNPPSKAYEKWYY